MSYRRTLCLLLAVGCASPGPFVAVDAGTGRTVSLSPAPLRRGQSFTGAYLSVQAGDLRLLQYGDRLEGSYQDFVCGCRIQGTLIGQVEDNLARFRFSERYSACEQQRTLQGRGFFFYQTLPSATSVARLYGERTYDSPHSGATFRRTPRSRISSVLTAQGATGTEAAATAHCP